MWMKTADERVESQLAIVFLMMNLAQVSSYLLYDLKQHNKDEDKGSSKIVGGNVNQGQHDANHRELCHHYTHQ